MMAITEKYADILIRIVSEHTEGIVWILRNKSKLLTKVNRYYDNK
jgi:hypothetical protein